MLQFQLKQTMHIPFQARSLLTASCDIDSNVGPKVAFTLTAMLEVAVGLCSFTLLEKAVGVVTF
jgi:hypothetical protein